MGDKMTLWKAVETTDTEFIRKVSQRGGFTAICAQYQLKVATEQWGPFGTTWGLRDLQYDLIRSVEEIFEQTLMAMFWYPGGEFPISTDIRYRPGDDSRKKLRTDAITKALSSLGFNADVFLGKFDDNKYVQERREADKTAEFLDSWGARITTCQDVDELNATIAELKDVKPPSRERAAAWDVITKRAAQLGLVQNMQSKLFVANPESDEVPFGEGKGSRLDSSGRAT